MIDQLPLPLRRLHESQDEQVVEFRMEQTQVERGNPLRGRQQRGIEEW